MPEHPLVLGSRLIPRATDGVVIENAESECDLDGIREAAPMTAAPFQGVQDQINFVLLAVMERDRGFLHSSTAGSFWLECRRRGIWESNNWGGDNPAGQGCRRFRVPSPPLLLFWLSFRRLLLRCGRGFGWPKAGG